MSGQGVEPRGGVFMVVLFRRYLDYGEKEWKESVKGLLSGLKT